MKKIFNKLAFGGILFISINIGAQVNKNELTKEEIKKISDQLKLVADKVPVKNEIITVDSALLMLELEEEKEDEFPADELYEGIWNDEFLKAYADVEVSETYKIDVSSFIMPVIGNVTSPYGPRSRRFHYGIDIKLQVGDTVYAAFDGKVRICSYERKGYGNYLVIRHPNGLETVYGHLSKSLVNKYENVAAGQPIALGGNTGRSTGSHLHFEFRFLGRSIDPSEIVDFTNFCTYDDHYVFNKFRSGNSYFNIDFYTQYKPLKGKNVKYYAAKAKKQNNLSEEITEPISLDGAQYYRVKRGDTLSEIANKYGTSVEKICRLNGIKKTTILRVGASLRCS